MLRKFLIPVALIAVAASAVIVGCNSAEIPGEPDTAPPPSAQKEAAHGGEDHGHKPGTHGGIIVSLGRDSYHAEAVFEKGRTIRLYMLGKEETRVQEVPVQDLTAFVTAEGSTDAVRVKFQPEPQPGDTAGKTSLFVATLPEDLTGKKVQVTINNMTIGSERFRISFSNEAVAHAEDAMPAKKTTAEERDLFLKPGGMYTAADIAANGNTVPVVKYRGIRPTHNSNPNVGQKICPISKTLANPKFTWVVGSKAYEFCCIPCIEEFVATAKDSPELIKDPAEYVKK